MRPDQKLIAEWIKPGSRVLDLGCGDGALLAQLQSTLGVTGFGIEIEPHNILECIKRGINVIHSDLDQGLSDFDADSFDYVVMTQTLQAMRFPARVLKDMLRVGREGIVTFPNMGHWHARLQFMLGRMPTTRALPMSWYETPNLHLCTIKDFEDLCRVENFDIIDRTAVDASHQRGALMRLRPSLFGEIALFRVRQLVRY
ncbi:MAG: methionine biosynthesis protein MetW [Gammaproteobacteria bacterium]|nr:methionine biosynthesis protein MetW [Gammaproteobacteria bacterium]